MKLLITMCLMAVGVSAQYGESGIVNLDGTLRQFTPEEAANIAEIGESGVVFKDGSHKQFSQDFAVHHNYLPAPPRPEPVPFGPYGYTGIVKPDGVNVQFTQDQASDIILVGPSGVVTADGKNVQLDSDGLAVRTKREVLYQGPSGVIFVDGQKRLLPRGVQIVLLTESGAVLSNGDNVQFRKKRAAPAKSKAIVGESGIITPGNRLIQLPHGVHVILEGPSAALLSNGDYVQYEF